jgi:hypothetical protein
MPHTSRSWCQSGPAQLGGEPTLAEPRGAAESPRKQPFDTDNVVGIRLSTYAQLTIPLMGMLVSAASVRTRSAP